MPERRRRARAEHGYAVVIQDVRGRYGSEGPFYIYVDEGRDGYDAVEWAAAQPWSNGDVGTYGGSYSAATQMALVVEAPPHLKAMYMQVGTANYWEDGAGSGGAFYLLHNLDYALYLASRGKEADANPAVQWALDYRTTDGQPPGQLGDWLRRFPFAPNASPLESAPSYRRWFQDWVDHPDYDGYWKQNGLTFERSYDRIPDVPIYLLGGWYDIFLRGTLANFAGLSARHTSPTKLMVGPWQHGMGPRATGDADFGASAALDTARERLRWFDQVLGGEDTGILDEPPVELFVMGGGDEDTDPQGRHRHGGTWATTSTWPPPRSTNRSLYLQAGGALGSRPPGTTVDPTIYTYDPTDPVPTIGGKIAAGRRLVPPGPFDQRCAEGEVFGCTDDLPLSSRPDVRVFQTAPLDKAVVVMGPVSVKLWVSSSARDTDFTAKLVDVHPPSEDYPFGYDMLLADRIVRARYRNSLERAEPLHPDQVYEITIDLLGTANRFQPGHRIRLDISSSNFPFFDVNPNTGEPASRQTTMETAVNTIFHDAARPSHLVLPIVEGPDTTSEGQVAQL